MAAVAVDEIIPGRIEDGGGADGDGFLAAVEMAEPADFLARASVLLVGSLFELSDEHHHPQALAFQAAIGFFSRGSPVYLIG